MKVALFVGDHAGDTLAVRAGWAITRKVQKGAYARVTHVEAIHAEHADGSVTIASASIRDGGVRRKHVRLNPLHWWIVDVPQWPVELSIAYIAARYGRLYDYRGAIATVFLGSPDPDREFCNKVVAGPFLKAPATFSPSQFAAICLSLGQDITDDFFNRSNA